MASQTPNQVYQPETAAEFYAELLSLHESQSDVSQTYAAFNRIFNRLLDENTSFARLNLVGPFAKTDYLLKEGHARQSLARQVNDLRVHLRQAWKGELSREELKKLSPTDFQSLCLFVSFLYSVSVPTELQVLFPDKKHRRKSRLVLQDCMRMLVESWDDRFLYGRLEEDGAERMKVCYADHNDNYPYDWTYLQPLFSVGTQVNLIRPRLEDGVLYPELIILEPDYLVDISQVARCMEVYADSPLVYLLNQLSPAAESEPILLGNFAGQMLDEELHYGRQEISYATSATEFFRHNALSLLSVSPGPGFHQEAQRQKLHIRQAIQQDLPLQVGAFDRTRVMVEPSFFSQMLGLQGRMDFLQLDYKLLIEQKAGKGAFVPGDRDPQTPKVQQQHYVQLLLYMALLRYNYREQYERNGKGLFAFLLYSKYAQPLLGLSFAPRLLFDALRLRNQLVWHQFRLADGGFGILESLTPEKLNQKGLAGKLWDQYKRPELEAILRPVHQASPLLRAYYFRMLSFVAREHLLSKLGNQTKENSGFSSIWLDSLEEKLSAGNIYHQLRLISPSEGATGRVETVSLQFHEEACNDMSNFRVGDIVILYSYEPETLPDACRSMVFRCSIQDIQTDCIWLSLRHAQTDAFVFLRHRQRYWAIEHDFYESSYTSLYRGLHALLSAPTRRVELLMTTHHPAVDDTLTLAGDYGRFNDLALRVRQAQELFLIIGPPGTGKTSYGMLNTLKEELLHTGTNVLIMSYTNRAVDEICSKLHGHIPFLRIGNALSCAPMYREHLLEERLKECRGVGELQQLIQDTRVFVGTTTSLASHQQLFGQKQFSLGIIDEASQILEPHLMGLLSATFNGEPAIRKIVMIGDHKQLPAVVQQREDESRVDDPQLQQIGLTDCRLSLFERLLRRYGSDPSVTYMLNHQGRMHPAIAEFPNRMFYEGKLTVVPLEHQLQELPAQGAGEDPVTDLLQTRRVIFLPSKLPEHSPSDKVNQVEADMIADIVRKVYLLNQDRWDVNETIGVIVPYRNQIATIRNTIAQFGIPELQGITIDTVERYQGSQRRYIIYGFTIQRHYQLRFLTNNTFMENGHLIDRKLNVAMTRAQEHLIIIGNPTLLQLNPVFRELVSFYGRAD